MTAVQLGVFVVPDAQDAPRTLAQIDAADASGLENLRFTVFVLSADDGGDPVGLVRRLGEDVAPLVREALGQAPGGR